MYLLLSFDCSSCCRSVVCGRSVVVTVSRLAVCGRSFEVSKLAVGLPAPNKKEKKCSEML
jgi:hypothetical protein